MTTANPPPLLPGPLRRVVGWTVLFLVLVLCIFTFPEVTGSGLDPSWRMALGYMFDQGSQFGRDVVFTYGPLGFIMGNTFCGVQFWGLIAGQLAMAIICAATIILMGYRLAPSARVVFFGFFLILGFSYSDALHMMVIAILGFELLRDHDDRWKLRTLLIAVVLAFLAQIKFTDLMLATFVVLVTSGYRVWRRHWRESAVLAGGYVVAFLVIWALCGQNIANLPAYFRASWSLSEGYQWAMGFSSATAPVGLGLVVLVAMIAYALGHLALNPDKPRAVANVLVLGTFIYLNWKHGFVRADGHVIGFFFCAILPLSTYPVLLEDPSRLRLLHRWVFVGLIALSVYGVEQALPGSVRGAMGQLEEKVWQNVLSVREWKTTRQVYRNALNTERISANLYLTREEVRRETVDVLGEEQNVAIMNRLNYQPRPVIQSYSTFTPLLAQLNYDFYASDHAPEFVLAKIQTIDNRLPTMDDSMVLRVLAYRYEFLRTEKGFQLWKRNPGAFDAAKFEPKLLHAETIAVDQPIPIKPWNATPLWLKIDLQPSLWGTLYAFLYKSPQVRITITDIHGALRTFLMPLPMGRTGFIINPFIDDPASYMEFAASRSKRLVDNVTVVIEPEDRKLFAHTVRYELSSLPSPSSGFKYFSNSYAELFHMFKTFPIAHEAQNPMSETVIDGRDVAIMHAPSVMTFDVPKGAKRVAGRFGFMPGAYSKGGRTNGADFVIYWSDGAQRVDIYQQFLDPFNNNNDRGLHEFEADLKGVTGGRLYLQVKPGPYNDFSWDWTGWTDIEIK